MLEMENTRRKEKENEGVEEEKEKRGWRRSGGEERDEMDLEKKMEIYGDLELALNRRRKRERKLKKPRKTWR